VTDAARRTTRTALQALLGLLAGLPLLVHTAGLPGTLPGLGTVLAVAATVTRLMALPQVDRWLPQWLRANDAPSSTVVLNGTTPPPPMN
jgi:hypothetical protein